MKKLKALAAQILVLTTHWWHPRSLLMKRAWECGSVVFCCFSSKKLLFAWKRKLWKTIDVTVFSLGQCLTFLMCSSQIIFHVKVEEEFRIAGMIIDTRLRLRIMLIYILVRDSHEWKFSPKIPSCVRVEKQEDEEEDSIEMKIDFPSTNSPREWSWTFKVESSPRNECSQINTKHEDIRQIFIHFIIVIEVYFRCYGSEAI